MIKWNQAPFARLLLPFLLGIILYNSFHFTPQNYLLWTTIISGLCILTAVLIRFFLNHFLHLIWAVFYFLFFLLLGLTVSNIHQSQEIKRISAISSQESIYLASVKKAFRKSESSYDRYLLTVQSPSNEIPVQVIAWVEKGDSLLNKNILFKAKITPLSKPLNPNETDFRPFYHQQGIFHQTFIRKKNYQLLPIPVNQKTSYTDQLRNYCNKILDKYLGNTNEKHLAQALLLGNKDYLSSDINTSFSNSGLIHLLAVSGLHVAILYLFITKLLGFFRMLEKNKWFFVLITLFCLWMYSILTGLSPSVKRAAFMMSLFVIAKAFSKYQNSYNILAASAFFLLVFNSNELFLPSFQLSYVAILSLIVFYKPIQQLFLPNNSIVQYIWDSIACSLAAQIGTIPIVIYYFGQVPLYATLANIIAIPFSFIVVLFGFLLILLAFIPILSVGLGYACFYSMKILMMIAEIVASIPGSTVNEIYINLTDLSLIFCVLTFLTLFIFSRKKAHLVIIIVSFIFYYSYQANLLIKKSHSKEMIVYHQKKGVSFSIREGLTCKVFSTLPIQILEKEKWYSTLKSTYTDFLVLNLNKNLETKSQLIYKLQYHQPYLAIGIWNDSILPADNMHYQTIIIDKKLKYKDINYLNRLKTNILLFNKSQYLKTLKQKPLSTKSHSLYENGFYCSSF